MNCSAKGVGGAAGAAPAHPAARLIEPPRLDVLKLAAATAMVVDHANTIVLGGAFPALRAIGRLAYPLFAFILAYNYVRHSRHPWRFIARLLLWGVVSQWFFRQAFENHLLNIFFTLALGLGYTEAFRSGIAAQVGIAIACVGLAVSAWHPVAAQLDFGIEGVLLVFAFAQFIDRPNWWHGLLVLVCTALLNHESDRTLWIAYNFSASASLLLIMASTRWPGEWRWVRRIRLGFYAFYPAHLFLLKLIARG